MAKYLVEAPHTKENCLQALDEVVAKDSRLLDKFDWGCFAGNHTGWAIIEGENEAAIRDTLPASQRDTWSVTAVTKFTPEQIAAYHQ